MKKSLIILSAGAFIMASCSTAPGVVMKSPALAGDTIMVNGNVLPFYDNPFSDTVVVAADGSFHFALPVDQVAAVEISSVLGGDPLELYLAPSERLEISASKSDDGRVVFSVETEGLNKGIQKFSSGIREFTKPLNDAVMAVNNAHYAGATEKTIDSLMQVYNDARQRYTDFIVNYFKENSQSPEAPFVILSAPSDSVESFVAALSEEGRASVLKPLIDQRIKGIKEMQLMKKAAESIKEGAPAPDFTLKDINGNDFSLSSLRGKYVILDFWGSWCGWCIKGIPDLKEAAEKYGDDIVILGVDCNDSEKAWRAAVEKHEMNWLHVYQPKDMDSDKKPSVLYNVTGFPTKLILGPDGNILNITIGEDPAFYDKLKEIVGR